MNKSVRSTKASSPYGRYLLTMKKLEEFVLYQYKQKDVNLSEIKLEFIINFENYLKTVLKYKFVTIRNYATTLKGMLNYGIQYNWLKVSPFKKHQTPYDGEDYAILTKEELTIIMANDFKTERLQMVKDLFIFQCFTGLGYIEIEVLTKSNIYADNEGNKWLSFKGRPTLPLLPQALAILEKYDRLRRKGKNKIFPYIRNQSINVHLTEIADMLRIPKKITNQAGKRTFGVTIALNNGMPLEIVSKLFGHSKLTTTQEFLNLVDNCPEYDMNQWKERFSAKF